MRQTAMQELLEFCEYRLSKASNNNVVAWNMILSKIKEDGLVEMEKQQIIDAFNMGMEEFANDTTIQVYQGEQYYNETFKNK